MHRMRCRSQHYPFALVRACYLFVRTSSSDLFSDMVVLKSWAQGSD